MKKWHVFLSFIVGLTLLSSSLPVSAAAADTTSNIQSFEPNSLVKNDGTYWVWGGDQSVPTQIQGMTDVKTSLGNDFVMKKDGSIWTFERNQSLSMTSIHEVKGLSSNISSIYYPIWNEIFVLDTNGKVYTSVHTADKLDPTQFVQLMGIDNVTSISSYYEYNQQGGEWCSIFLKKDGTVWKSNDSLQSFKPLSSLNDITAIDRNFALKKDGTVWTWPNEISEKVAPVNTTPTKISGLRNIKTIKSNGNTNLIIDDQSRLWFWGATITGWSDGTTYHEEKVPVLLTNVKNVKDAFIIERTLVVLTQSGNVYETSIEGTSLSGNAKFTLLTSGVDQIKQGYRSVIMQKGDKTLWGWGVNKDAQLGYGDYEFMHSSVVPMQKPVSVHLNGTSVALNNGVIIQKSQAFIPLRSVFEKLGATITFDNLTKVVTITRSDVGMPPLTISINYKSGVVTVNNKVMTLQNTPFSVNGTSYLPLRFISETLGATVDWVQKDDKISITMK